MALCDWEGTLIEPCSECKELKSFAEAIKLANELRARIAELEKNQLKPGEVRARVVDCSFHETCECQKCKPNGLVEVEE